MAAPEPFLRERPVNVPVRRRPLRPLEPAAPPLRTPGAARAAEERSRAPRRYVDDSETFERSQPARIREEPRWPSRDGSTDRFGEWPAGRLSEAGDYVRPYGQGHFRPVGAVGVPPRSEPARGRGKLAPIALLATAIGVVILWPMLHRAPASPASSAAPAASSRAIVVSSGQTAQPSASASARPSMPPSPRSTSQITIDPAAGRLATSILQGAGGTGAMVLQVPGQAPFASVNADQPLPSASLYKLGVMAAVYQAMASGGVTLDQQITVTQQDVDTYGDAPATDPGTVLTVKEALTRMITVSDNSAAGALIDLVGFDTVNAAYGKNGMPHSHLGDVNATGPTPSLAETTASDQAAFYNRLLAGQVVSQAASEDMIALLEGQQENDRLPALLPAGTTVAHKTGEIDGVRNDSGIIFTPRGPVIAAVLVSDQETISQAIDAIAHIGLVTYDAAAGLPLPSQ